MGEHAPIRPMDEAAIAEAARIIRSGGLVAFGTETVYGLGGDATNAEAVAKIFAAKGRPSFNPLISHVAETAAAEACAAFDSRARKIAAAFWPGPMTLVLKKAPNGSIAELTTAGLSTVAVRVPQSEPARRFLDACGVPVAAPSANASGAVSPTMAAHVQNSLPGPDDDGPALILDAGPCEVGLESTVLDLSGDRPTLLRPGGVTREEIEALIGPVAEAGTDDTAPKSPGMLSRHYAPTLPLRMNADGPETGETFIGFGAISQPDQPNLSTAGDPVEAAANLFRLLHEADASDATGIAVAPIPDVGLGRAINDRLRRGSKG